MAKEKHKKKRQIQMLARTNKLDYVDSSIHWLIDWLIVSVSDYNGICLSLIGEGECEWAFALAADQQIRVHAAVHAFHLFDKQMDNKRISKCSPLNSYLYSVSEFKVVSVNEQVPCVGGHLQMGFIKGNVTFIESAKTQT
jgi:hypothetical protein